MADVRLEELRDWLARNWDPDLTVREWWAVLAASGWSQPDWPEQWFGRGTSRADATMVARAIRRAGALTGPTGFATGLVGPTLLVHGTDDQKARHLPGMVTGADAYCQLFSEPNAGSDLAGLQTRAERDGDHWVVNGQKVWTSQGQIANKAMLLARTNPDVPKHAGISYFIVDVRQPGVEIRPLREMTGRSFFNEVFITDALVSAADLIGGEGNGWRVANTTLAFERAYSGGETVGTPAQPGPLAGDLDRPAGALVGRDGSKVHGAEQARTSAYQRVAGLASATGRRADPVIRQRLAMLYALERLNGLNTERARALQGSGADLPGLPNMAKMMLSHVHRLARDLTFEVLGPRGTLFAYEEKALEDLERRMGVPGLGAGVEAGLFAQGPPIYGGSDQIQRNIVGDRVLGLPREPAGDRDVPFRDLPKN